MVDQAKVDAIVKAVKAGVKANPEVSDKEFLAEYEVSDEDYRRGFSLPGVGMQKPKGKKRKLGDKNAG